MNEPVDLTDLLEDDFDGETRVLPRQQHSYPPVAMPPPPKKSDAPIWAGVLGATFVFALAAAGIAGFFVWQHHKASDASADTTSAAAPVADTAAAAPTPTTTPSTTTPATTTEIEPLAVASSAPATTHAAAAPRGHGVLQTFAVGRGKTLFVDGKAVGVGGEHVKAACGRHSVAVGSAKARTYEIPCNGSTITVGTPDGT